MRTLSQSKPIGKEEYTLLKQACTNVNLRKAMALMYYGGFRVNEVLQFTCKAIAELLNKGEIDALITKQGILRTLSLTPHSREELASLLSISKGEYFVHYDGDSLRVQLNRFLYRVLGEGYTSHGFRRGFITHIITKTKDPKLAQEVIGHKDVKTTLRYHAPTALSIKNAYALID